MQLDDGTGTERRVAGAGGLRLGLLAAGAPGHGPRTQQLIRLIRAAPLCGELVFVHADPAALQLEARETDVMLACGLDDADLGALERALPAGRPLVVLDAPQTYRPRAARPGAVLRRAWTTADLDAVLQLVVRGGSYADPAESDAVDEPLTAREHEVLGKLAEGWTNRGIAMELAISENTVKFHLSAVFRKLGAEGRTEAIVTGVQRGLLSL